MRQLIAIILTLCCIPAFGQSNTFSGKIVYEYQFLNPATGQDITSTLKQYFGQEQHYYANASNYKAYDENGQLRQLYNSDTNTYYYLNPSSSQLMKLDATNQTSKVVSVEHFKETQQILGRECKKLVIKTVADETIYWYSPKIKVNPKNFKDHNIGNWNTYIKESKGALPLKFTVKSQNYTWIATATEIEAESLTNQDFQIANEIEKK